MEIKNTNNNNVIISEDVIAKVASIAATDVKGVHGVVPKPVNIKGIFKDEASKAVVVEKNGKSSIIDIYIKIEEGYKVQTVAEEVQKAVKEQVQNMTNIVITKVNVHISEIELKKEESAEKDA